MLRRQGMKGEKIPVGQVLLITSIALLHSVFFLGDVI